MQTINIRNSLGVYKLDFRGPERKRNLFCVLEKLRYTDENIENEIYERFRLGDDVSFGVFSPCISQPDWIWTGKYYDAPISKSYMYGSLTGGERVFKVNSWSIEGILRLYTEFLTFGYKCHLQRNFDLKTIQNHQVKREYIQEEEIINWFNKYGPEIFDSEFHRYFTIVVKKKIS